LLYLVMMIPWIPRANAEEWESRGGNCFDWQGRWQVDRDQSGVWVGNIDFDHVGGPCLRASHSRDTQSVRAVIVGSDFFARREGGGTLCMIQGTVRNEYAATKSALAQGLGPLRCE
jgi:hypothetical protein